MTTDRAPGKLNRRDFLKFSGAGTALLAGNVFVPGRGLAKRIARPGKSTVTITTHDWYGDIEERLDFPEDWQVRVVEMDGHRAPVIGPEEIREKLARPIGTKLLRDIAYGKKTAAITFDDLTRPTPVGSIAPFVIEELNKGGIRDENILFVASYGTHKPMSQIEVRAKLGDEIVSDYPWINHNIWENLTDVGVTSFRNRIKVNYYFMQADVKVCISGVKPHTAAGYGGGGKAVLPGVTWEESTSYNHRVILGAGYRTNEKAGLGKIFKNDVRLDMEEAAKLAGVDFTVQVVMNGKRQPVGVFAGDSREAHLEACRMANKHYRTQPIFPKPEIVIANSYPQAAEGPAVLSESRELVKDGGSVVLVVQNPMGLPPWHYNSERQSFRFLSYWDKLPTSSPVPEARQIIFFSQYLQKRDMNKFSAKHVRFARTWDQVLELLKKEHPGGAATAVYPYAPIQHPPIDLDG